MGKDGKVEGAAVGIDLGTTYSCVGIWQNDRVEIIANDQGNRTTPSFVAFTETERMIGDAAKNQAAMNPTNTVFDAKRYVLVIELGTLAGASPAMLTSRV
jgi:heat shock protein 1/8